jgi:hypothetical protein
MEWQKIQSEDWPGRTVLKDESYGNDLRLTLFDNGLIRYDFKTPEVSTNIIDCQNENTGDRYFEMLKPVLTDIHEIMIRWGRIDHDYLRKKLKKFRDLKA